MARATVYVELNPADRQVIDDLTEADADPWSRACQIAPQPTTSSTGSTTSSTTWRSSPSPRSSHCSP